MIFFMDHLDFLGNILLFRTARDMNSSCSPGPDPELWLDISLESISTGDWTDQEKQELSLTSKMADLIDDRKAWLLEEVSKDLYAIEHPGCFPVSVEIPDQGHSFQWWSDRDPDGNFSMSSYDETICLSADIKADDEETALELLREQVRKLTESNLPVAA